MTVDEFEEDVQRMERGWGTGEYERHFLKQIAPSLADHEEYFQWWARYSRLSASPGAAISLSRMWYATDVRGILQGIAVPCLVLWRAGDTWAAESRYLAEHVPGAKSVELGGDDHLPWVGDSDAVLREIERFVASVLDEEAEFDRVLATVMFTDIVGSTERAAEIGDHRWKQLLEAHQARVRGQLARYRGREIDTAGDGFLATFDGPARAVRCAMAIAKRHLGLEIRAGLHTGEVEMVGEKVGGIAVHVGARVADLAQPGEVLVSSTVKDLVAGSGLAFEDAGEHELRGVPDRWRLYRAVS
jgi:class 3 adenylate cyclase